VQETTIIRQADRKGLEFILDLATAEGWNPGKYDGESFFASDENGFLILYHGNEPIGSIAVVQLSKDYAAIGLFIVAKKHRSQGFGTLLWNEAIKRLAHCRTIGLNAVPSQVKRYQAAEFKDSFANQRWSKAVDSKAEDTKHLISTAENPYLMFKKLCEYDELVFKHPREKFLTAMLLAPQTFAFVSFDKDRAVNGYGVVRPCIKGYRIGPLYAADFESAQTLCRLLLAKIPGEIVVLDTPIINKFGIAFAEYFGLEHIPAADTLAMFKGEQPESKNTSDCYAVASLEIG